MLATDDQQQSTNVAVDAPLLCRANAAAWRGRPDPVEIGDVEVADTDPDPIARLFRFDERFYRLRRK